MKLANVIKNAAIVSYSWTLWLMIFVTACLIGFVQWKKYKSSQSFKTFPSLPSVPIIGSLHLVFGNMQTRIQRGLKVMKIVEKPTIFWFSFIPVVVLTRSEHILQVVNKNQDRYTLGVFANFLEDGILLARGEKWRNIRRIMNPAFSIAMLQQYMVVFNEQSSILVKRLADKANSGKVIDLWQYIIDMNFDTVTENMMDYKMHVQENGENEFSEAILKALQLESRRGTSAILIFNVFFTIYLYLSGNRKLYEKVNKLPKKIVREKIRKFEEQKQNGHNAEGKPVKTLIDLLLRVHDAHPEFDERRMRVEILNMIFAGSDTTATTVSLAFLFLAIHPEIQEKVYQEIRQVFNDDLNGEVQMEHCNKLKYMDQCIKETLRRFSLVPLTARYSPDPVKLNDEQTIPAESMIVFAYHAVHQDPIAYPQPDKFDPDRFSPEKNTQNGNNFMGFGAGPRACIGARYAMLSMKTQLVHVLRRYKLTTDIQMCDIVHIVDMLSRSQNGYPVKIWERQNGNEFHVK